MSINFPQIDWGYSSLNNKTTGEETTTSVKSITSQPGTFNTVSGTIRISSKLEYGKLLLSLSILFVILMLSSTYIVVSDIINETESIKKKQLLLCFIIILSTLISIGMMIFIMYNM